MNPLGLLKLFQKVTIAEGVSLLSFAITMPLKYIWEIGLPNKIVGIAHGIIFILFIFLLGAVALERKWKVLPIFWLGFSSIIPFASFIADKKIIKKEIRRVESQQ
ncbi:MAG: integral membrane protein [Lentimonas sp.]|jgi:integral membrane protein